MIIHYRVIQEACLNFERIVFVVNLRKDTQAVRALGCTLAGMFYRLQVTRMMRDRETPASGKSFK